MTDFPSKSEICYYPFWKVSFAPKVGVPPALNTKPQRFSKMFDWAKS
jgi:hypothetical protein